MTVSLLACFVACGVSRLARHNVTAEAFAQETGKVTYFEGTPIPTSTALVLLLMAAAQTNAVGDSMVWQLVDRRPYAAPADVALFGVSGSLMISRNCIPSSERPAPRNVVRSARLGTARMSSGDPPTGLGLLVLGPAQGGALWWAKRPKPITVVGGHRGQGRVESSIATRATRFRLASAKLSPARWVGASRHWREGGRKGQKGQP